MSEIPLENDLLWGIESIAKAINRSPRQTHYALTKGLIPAGQQGDSWVASRTVLCEHYARLTSSTKKKSAP